jgi:hypothetical protein
MLQGKVLRVNLDALRRIYSILIFLEFAKNKFYSIFVEIYSHSFLQSLAETTVEYPI